MQKTSERRRTFEFKGHAVRERNWDPPAGTSTRLPQPAHLKPRISDSHSHAWREEPQDDAEINGGSMESLPVAVSRKGEERVCRFYYEKKVALLNRLIIHGERRWGGEEREKTDSERERERERFEKTGGVGPTKDQSEGTGSLWTRVI